MTAQLIWHPVTNGGVLTTGAAATVIEKLRLVFDDFPLELDEHDLDQLQIMIAMCDSADGKLPFQQIVQAIEMHGIIRVEAEY